MDDFSIKQKYSNPKSIDAAVKLILTCCCNGNILSFLNKVCEKVAGKKLNAMSNDMFNKESLDRDSASQLVIKSTPPTANLNKN
jgi:hypothetical protein